MYHNHYTPAQRPQYLELLSKAEELLPQSLNNADALRIVILAASAVRGSDVQLSRMKYPITPQQYTTLLSLIRTSRTYVTNFWPEAATTSSALAGSPMKKKMVVKSTSQPTPPAHGGSPDKSKVVVKPTSQPSAQPIPNSSFLTPNSSFLTPNSSFLTPHSSFLIPLMCAGTKKSFEVKYYLMGNLIFSL